MQRNQQEQRLTGYTTEKHTDTDEMKREEVQMITEGCRSGLHVFASQIRLMWKLLQGSQILGLNVMKEL